MRWYQCLLLVISGALMAGTPVAQQTPFILRSERLPPPPAFDGDLRKLAAASPEQPVSLLVEFAPTTSIEALADLIFAERIRIFSIYVTTRVSKKKSYIHGYSFSVLGPAREDQVARAHCQEQVPFESSESGPDAPLQPKEPRVSKSASLIVPAAQAQRWLDAPPAGVTGVKLPTLVGQESVVRDEQVMRNVLTLQMPATGVTRVPAGCEKYLSIRR
jgi:hypothetical protein